MALCKRCGRVTEGDEIHLFRGGEERRLAVEEAFKTMVTLCANPPPAEFWSNDKKEWYERDDVDSGKPLTMNEADIMFEKWLIENGGNRIMVDEVLTNIKNIYRIYERNENKTLRK